MSEPGRQASQSTQNPQTKITQRFAPTTSVPPILHRGACGSPPTRPPHDRAGCRDQFHKTPKKNACATGEPMATSTVQRTCRLPSSTEREINLKGPLLDLRFRLVTQSPPPQTHISQPTITHTPPTSQSMMKGEGPDVDGSSMHDSFQDADAPAAHGPLTAARRCVRQRSCSRGGGPRARRMPRADTVRPPPWPPGTLRSPRPAIRKQ